MMLPSIVAARVPLAPDWHPLIEAMASLGPMQVWVGNAAASIVRRVEHPNVAVHARHIDFIAEVERFTASDIAPLLFHAGAYFALGSRL